MKNNSTGLALINPFIIAWLYIIHQKLFSATLLKPKMTFSFQLCAQKDA